MTTIVIGSTALALRAPHLLNRVPRDVDLVCDQAGLDRWVAANPGSSIEWVNEGKAVSVKGLPCPVEIEVTKDGSTTQELIDLVRADPDTTVVNGWFVPSLDVLFTLKTSHRYLKDSPHFWKNLMDWHRMRAAGVVVRDEYREFLRRREKETYARQSHPSLMRNKDQFFSGDGVKYVYDHDSIHRAVATYDRPAYTMYARDGHDVMSDRAKFEALPMEVRVAGVVEESCVLAIERSLVPHPGKLDPKRAWLLALSKVCTSITSGWFRRFAYEHCLDVLRAYPHGYWERFQSQVGTVVKQYEEAA